MRWEICLSKSPKKARLSVLQLIVAPLQTFKDCHPCNRYAVPSHETHPEMCGLAGLTSFVYTHALTLSLFLSLSFSLSLSLSSPMLLFFLLLFILLFCGQLLPIVVRVFVVLMSSSSCYTCVRSTLFACEALLVRVIFQDGGGWTRLIPDIMGHVLGKGPCTWIIQLSA